MESSREATRCAKTLYHAGVFWNSLVVALALWLGWILIFGHMHLMAHWYCPRMAEGAFVCRCDDTSTVNVQVRLAVSTVQLRHFAKQSSDLVMGDN